MKVNWTFFSPNSLWYLNGNYLVIMVSASIILPLALMKQLGEQHYSHTCSLSLTVCRRIFETSADYNSFLIDANEAYNLDIWLFFVCSQATGSAQLGDSGNENFTIIEIKKLNEIIGDFQTDTCNNNHNNTPRTNVTLAIFFFTRCWLWSDRLLCKNISTCQVTILA